MKIKSFAVKDLNLGDEGHVRVAFAETGSVDREGDYTFAGAIPDRDVIVSSYGHKSWPQKGGELPVGKGHVSEVGNLAIFEGDFFLDTTHGRDTFLTVKHLGDQQEWSYGYDVKAEAKPPAGIKALRGLKSLDIFEVSPVLIGAGLVNGGPTRTLDIKALGTKGAAADVSSATYALGTILQLITDESIDLDPDDPDAADDQEDIATLSQARDLLTTYIVSTAKEVGSADDIADLLEEAAARAAVQASYGPYWDNASIEAAIKEGSLAGLPMAELSSRVLRDVKLWTARSKGIVDLRLKEGRAISSARLEQLRAHSSALADAKKAIDEMVASATPKDTAEGKARQMRMRASLAMTGLDYPITPTTN